MSKTVVITTTVNLANKYLTELKPLPLHYTLHNYFSQGLIAESAYHLQRSEKQTKEGQPPARGHA